MTLSIAQASLLSCFESLPNCLVAFSGGVDSAVVAKAAHVALGNRAVAVTGVSDSLASGELETARRIADSIGIRHQILNTEELNNPGYLANDPNRCWHCKTELYSQMRGLANRMGIECLANGTNYDDLGDFRPGLRAALEHDVLSPLVECKIDKRGVRQIALDWNIEVWDKPASPCLSSRVVYGLEITPERLGRIDAAETLLKSLGFTSVRVRCHHDDLARLEVAANEIAKLSNDSLRSTIASRLREIGFRFVTIDLEGFRSGSFLPLVKLASTKS